MIILLQEIYGSLQHLCRSTINEKIQHFGSYKRVKRSFLSYLNPFHHEFRQMKIFSQKTIHSTCKYSHYSTLLQKTTQKN